MPTTITLDIQKLRTCLDEGDVATAAELAVQASPADLAEALVRLTPTELAVFGHAIGIERLADALAELDASEAARLMLRFGRATGADILEQMEPDDATDLVEALEPEDAAALLEAMEPEEAEEIRALLEYPPNSAGGRMTTQFVAVDQHITVARAIRVVRAQSPQAEMVYYLYVVDERSRLVGVVSLRELITSPPRSLIGEIMQVEVAQVQTATDQEEAARLLVDRGLLALPVVDETGRLVGVLTADDVADVLEEEATEDIERLGGSQPLEAPYLLAGPLHHVRKRLPWLLALFLAEAYTGTVLRLYEDEMSKMIALTFFIPLLIGTGGNTGSQVTTTLTRSIALGDVQLSDFFRVLRKEFVVALLLGVGMAAASYLRALILGVGDNVGLVVALTAAAIVVWSGTIASVLPLLLRRLRVDPAVVSAPLITTLVDGTGLIIYFTIAKYLLQL